MAITIPVFQYQQKAEVPQTSAAPVVPDQPWLLLDPPTRRRHQVPGEGTLPPAIALPYDLPLLDASPVVVRRVEMRRDGYASPVAPLPYDFPLTAPPEIVRPKPRVQDTSSPKVGEADPVVVPDLVAGIPVEPLRPRRMAPLTPQAPPVLDPQPFPGDLATTIVAGSLPCAIIPSGMTPGDDSDG